MMNRKLKRNFLAVFSGSLALFLFLTGLIFYRRFLPLRDVKVFEFRDGMVLGINEDGFDSELFLVSAETEEGCFLRRVHLENDGNRTVLDAVCAEDGSVLFLEELLYLDGTSTDRVYSWIPGERQIKPGTDTAFREAKEAAEAAEKRDGAERRRTAYGFEDEEGNAVIRVVNGTETKDIYHVWPAFSRVVPWILSALVLSVLVCILLLLLTYHLTASGIYLGIRSRLSIAAVFLFFLFITVFTWFLSRFYYAFTSRHEVYHCADTVVMKSIGLDAEALERILSGEEPLTKRSFSRLWMHASEEDSMELRRKIGMNEVGELFLLSEDELRIIVKEGGDLILVDGTTKPDPVMGRVTDPLRAARYQNCFDTGKPLVLTTSGRGGQYVSCYIPMKLKTGREAILGAHMGVSRLHISLYNEEKKVIGVCVGLSCLTLAVILILLSRGLSPLKNLRNAVAGVAAGKLSSRAEVKGVNEITRTADAFNVMAEQLEAQSAGADSWRRFYESFFPASLLREFSGKKLETALMPGYGWSAPRTVLALEDVPQEQFDTAIRTAVDAGGQLVGLTDDGIKFLFKEDGESAVRVAQAVQQKFREAGHFKVYTGIASGTASIFVEGSVSRFTVCEQDSGEASGLSRLAQSLDIPVILTEALYLEAERRGLPFHFRCLGRIGISDYTPERPVYELLDAEEAELHALKSRLVKYFDLGREAYAAGDYVTARREMIRVLNGNPGDLAARSYILCCDRKEPPAVCQAEKHA